MQNQKLLKIASILGIIVLLVIILVYAKSFLIPLTFAALLAMLLLPVVNWLQRKGAHSALAALAAVLLIVSFFAGIIFFISSQVSDLAGNTSKIEQLITKKRQQIQEKISTKIGITPAKQDKMIDEQQKAAPGKMTSMITGILSGAGSFLTNTLLVLVYIFLFIFFRGKIKEFMIRIVSRSEKGNMLEIIESAQKVTQKYLTGLALMIVCLWIMYGIGFSIVGIKYAFFFAILCGLLEIVPFVGNLTGTALTVIITLIQGAGWNLVLGILITYAIVQFLQTYLLEPLVVGAEVNINPLFTIVGLVAGELLWGIPGMILAIPLLGIAKIVCDHIEPLKPYGYLIGADKKEKKFLVKKK